MTEPSTQERKQLRRPWMRTLLPVTIAVAAAVVIVVAALAIGRPSSAGDQLTALQRNPDLDPGTALAGRAPNFALTDQFGRSTSLRSFRGHVVVLAFNDSECTTVCPLTTSAMVEAKALLGASGDRVDLLGIDANPNAIKTSDVLAYSRVHGMLHRWRFLTGSLAQLRAVWRAYKIEVAIQGGQIDHTPALYVIDTRGRLARVYLTQMSYRSVDQQAQILAREASSLLPGHPRVRSALSYDEIPSVSTHAAATIPRAGGGTVRIGPHGAARLYVFFASWLTETIPLASDLDTLNGYVKLASSGGLPPLTAVDEGSVEPSAAALPAFLRTLRTPLAYSIGVDASGRVADGYLAQDEPWFVLVSSSGQILWYWDASTQGWLTTAELIRHVGASLRSPPTVTPPRASQVPRVLAGSPPALASLHRQASQLLTSGSLAKRIRALRGYPIVVNVWASWCTSCQAEYPQFAAASVRFGRTVAFLGANTDDFGASVARGYLAGHPLSYPSYEVSTSDIAALAPPGINGLPGTIYIDRRGRVTYVTQGEYDSQGSLDGDIQTYALGA